jgi:hypothetical protein
VGDKTYNGWTNYETWCVNLHLSNEQSEQEYWEQLARDCLEADDYDAQFNLAGLMEEGVGEACPELPGLYGDLIRASLSEVNWNEIAWHYIDGARAEVSDAN